MKLILKRYKNTNWYYIYQDAVLKKNLLEGFIMTNSENVKEQWEKIFKDNEKLKVKL